MKNALPTVPVDNLILEIRGQKVITDADLARLYEVETKRLNEQVKRNMERFPEDFMFQLSEDEFHVLKSHFATSSWGGRRFCLMCSQNWMQDSENMTRLLSPS